MLILVTVYTRCTSTRTSHRGTASLLFLDNLISDYYIHAMRTTDLVIFSDLTDEVTESLIDVDSLLGGRLDEFASEVFRQVTTLCRMLVHR
jgi:hypothetical protein